MRIALSFRGKIGNLNGRDGEGELIDLNVTYNHLRKHILEKYETDIFINCINENKEEIKDKLNSVFNPIYLEVENQKKFGISREISLIEMKDEAYNGNTLGQTLRVISEKYSMFKCLKAVENYEDNNNFNYDFVILLRLDQIFLKDIKFEELDKNLIYSMKKIKFSTKQAKPLIYQNHIEGIVDSGIFCMFNTKLIKNSKYEDIFTFNIVDQPKDNIFSKIKNYNCFSTIYPLYKNNKIGTIELGTVELIRRVYSTHESHWSNGKKLPSNSYVSKEELEKNLEKYKNFYLK